MCIVAYITYLNYLCAKSNLVSDTELNYLMVVTKYYNLRVKTAQTKAKKTEFACRFKWTVLFYSLICSLSKISRC
jgi:hypothetical protein